MTATTAAAKSDFAAQLDTLSELTDRVREVVGRIRGHAPGKEPFAQALRDKQQVSEELGALLVEMLLPDEEFPSSRIFRAQEVVGQIIAAAGLSSVTFGQLAK